MSDQLKQRNIQRVDRPKGGKHQGGKHGFEVKVQFGKQRIRKWFPDSEYDGDRAAGFAAAQALLERIKRELHLPTTSRNIVGSPIKSSTGIRGISKPKNRDHYVVTCPDPREPGRSIRKYVPFNGNERKARMKAIAIRRAGEEAAYGSVIVKNWEQALPAILGER